MIIYIYIFFFHLISFCFAHLGPYFSYIFHILILLIIIILFYLFNFWFFFCFICYLIYKFYDFIKLHFDLNAYRVQMQTYVAQNSLADTVSCQILKRQLEGNQASEHVSIFVLSRRNDRRAWDWKIDLHYSVLIAATWEVVNNPPEINFLIRE